MRHLILIHLISFALFFIGCETVPQSPSNEVEKIEVAAKIETIQAKELIFKAIEGDQCSKETYLKQGKAPPGYHKGISLTAAQIFCNKGSEVYKIGSQALGDPAQDALSHYGLKPASESLRLSNTLGLMIGSNARESSWRPCVGRDIAAKESDVKGCLYGSGSTCEAGLAQTSYNSVPKSGALRDLFNSFQDYPKGCFKTEYYGKTTCSDANWKNHGSDPQALLFQEMSKQCPGFTIQSGVIMFRTKRSHYGPLNRKTAEVKVSCVDRFETIRKLIESNPEICKAI